MLKAFSPGKDLQLPSFKASNKSGDFWDCNRHTWTICISLSVASCDVNNWLILFILMEIDSMRQI